MPEATHSVDDSDLVCQPGARWEDINSALREKAIPLFFPVCPLVSKVIHNLIYLLELDPGPGAVSG